MDIRRLVAYLIRFSVKIFPHFRPEKMLKMISNLYLGKWNILRHVFVTKTVWLVKARFFSEFTFQMSVLWIPPFITSKLRKNLDYLSVYMSIPINLTIVKMSSFFSIPIVHFWQNILDTQSHFSTWRKNAQLLKSI